VSVQIGKVEHGAIREYVDLEIIEGVEENRVLPQTAGDYFDERVMS